ncbi:LuxR family maltose regulon positive regulatory protein [Haloactinopolyspora alba]|uniref:LuxR family maltose regulon positive regulatory protein n=1 Tax=Haloactinopolyspora alba TaxID=648780 RepID=A0A2P8E007_9ACTN|nr:LuxR C-terminal-related transcriptional regulator [Haloactinopolyspora alba]PSL02802.1 LuxR family maltose regulon positive regulatory protein [Haloactinopolyspora alba]
MLLSQFWRSLRPEGVSAAWLSLDEHDNDPYVLWSGILRACGRAVRGLDTPAEVRLGALSPPADGTYRGFLTAFVDALDSLPGVLWIILDDVHVVTSGSALDGLAALLKYRPSTLRLALGSRMDPPLPTARLLLDGHAWALRAADLAFDRSEADQLLRGHAIELDEHDLAVLMARTEGWAAGLSLAALSLASQDDVSKYIAGFAGDERPLADYLVAEVLASLSEETVDLLLATSVAETLTADLASRLSGRDDAGAVLARLARDNALVYRVGRGPTSYRLHGLLRSFLLAEGARRNAQAQRRHHLVASEWFADHHIPGSALDHAVSGEDWPRVAELVHREGVRLLLDSEAPSLRRAFRSMPEDVLAQPTTALIGALAALEKGALSSARRYIDRVGRRPEAHESPRLRLLHATALLYEARLCGDRSARLVELIDLSDRPAGAEPDLELLAAVNRGILRIWFTEYRRAEADLVAALRMARHDGRDALTLECLCYLAVSAAARGDFVALAGYCDEAIEFAGRKGWSSAARMAPVYLLGAGVAWQRLDDTEAARLLSLVATVDADLEPEVDLSARLLEACLAAAEAPSRRDAVRRLRQAWPPHDELRLLPVSVSSVCLTELQLALSAGDRFGAAEALGRAERVLGDAGDVRVMRALLHARAGRKAAARSALGPVLSGTIECHVVSSEITGWLLSAHFAAESDEQARAHEALLCALDLAAPRQMFRELIAASARVKSMLIHNDGRFGEHDEFVRRVVAATAVPDRAVEGAAMVSGEALTARELDLLRDLPSLLSLEEIADAHVLSVNTVKTHLKAIYRKFDVGSRRQAVDRARELGLL